MPHLARFHPVSNQYIPNTVAHGFCSSITTPILSARVPVFGYLFHTQWKAKTSAGLGLVERAVDGEHSLTSWVNLGRSTSRRFKHVRHAAEEQRPQPSMPSHLHAQTLWNLKLSGSQYVQKLGLSGKRDKELSYSKE